MTYNNQNDLLIIPDVHGRTFWRKAVATNNFSHVIFLGDYTDPYTHEDIYQRDAYKELMDIIKYAKEHRETTTVLLGNHDMHYKSELFKSMAGGSRYSYSMSGEYAKLFNDNDELFQLAYEADYEDTHCLFTHAGVSSVWYEDNKQVIGELTVDNLNRLAHSEEGIDAIAEVGRMRGGWAKAGGILWADYDEVAASEPLEGVLQIFGHTQNFYMQPVYNRHIACLDCHRAFLLSEVIQMVKGPSH